MKQRCVGIYVYDEVEVLDFAGPFEVFSVASRLALRDAPGTSPPFRVLTVAAAAAEVRARGGLRVVPDASIASHPPLDVVIVPGGVMEAQRADRAVVAWVAAQAATAEVVASVCTGAFLLAEAGLLEGRRVATHWEDRDDLARAFPGLHVVPGMGWIDEGRILTAAGISAGIDAALHLVGRFCSDAFAARAAHQMEYAWRRNPAAFAGAS